MVWRGQQARLMTQKLLKTELGKRLTVQLKLELASILGCTGHSLVAVPGSALSCPTDCTSFSRLFLKTPGCSSAEGIQRIPPRWCKPRPGANLIPQGQDKRHSSKQVCFHSWTLETQALTQFGEPLQQSSFSNSSWTIFHSFLFLWITKIPQI